MMNLSIRPFEELKTGELYAALKLRSDIFVVEQRCAYSDPDDFDQLATHVMGIYGDQIVAYARILPPQTVYEQPSIGRVCVHRDFRNRGFGRKIFNSSLREAQRIYPKKPIKIQAQIYLEDFYRSCAFKTISEPYLDFDIWHVDMLQEI